MSSGNCTEGLARHVGTGEFGQIFEVEGLELGEKGMAGAGIEGIVKTEDVGLTDGRQTFPQCYDIHGCDRGVRISQNANRRNCQLDKPSGRAIWQGRGASV